MPRECPKDKGAVVGRLCEPTNATTGDHGGMSRSDEGAPPGMVEKLTNAATAAIRNEAPSIERRPDEIRSVVVELELDRSGAIVAADSYVQRHVTINETLGLAGRGR